MFDRRPSTSITNANELMEQRRKMRIQVPMDIKITAKTPLKYKKALRTGIGRALIISNRSGAGAILTNGKSIQKPDRNKIFDYGSREDTLDMPIPHEGDSPKI